jgi:hypothetical protein
MSYLNDDQVRSINNFNSFFFLLYKILFDITILGSKIIKLSCFVIFNFFLVIISELLNFNNNFLNLFILSIFST